MGSQWSKSGVAGRQILPRVSNFLLLDLKTRYLRCCIESSKVTIGHDHVSSIGLSVTMTTLTCISTADHKTIKGDYHSGIDSEKYNL